MWLERPCKWKRRPCYMSGRQTQQCTTRCLVDLRLVLLLATDLEVLASLHTTHTQISIARVPCRRLSGSTVVGNGM